MESHELITFIFISIFNFKCLNIYTNFGIIKTNGHIALAKYPIKYLELLFTLISFEITILPTLTTQTFIGCFAA